MTEPTAREQQMARDNVELFRRLQEYEALDRERLSRIAGLKLRVAELEELNADAQGLSEVRQAPHAGQVPEVGRTE